MPGGVLIIGERINATRRSVAEAIARRDSERVKALAREQLEAGAEMLDLNAGRAEGNEAEDLVWLVDTVGEITEAPLCLDSSDPEALKGALERAGKGALVNSVTPERERLEGVGKLAAAHGARIVALTMGGGKVPQTVEDRLSAARILAEELQRMGFRREDVYFDPCVLSAATSPEQPLHVLESVRRIRKEFPDSHVLAGLSNVSFGFPRRRLLNRAYLAMLMCRGADAFLLDVLDPGIRQTMAASRVLAGADEYGLEYLRAVRSGAIQPSRGARSR